MDVSWFEVSLTTVILILTAAVLYYRFLVSHFGYLEKQGVPVDKPRVLFGTLNLKKRLYETDLDGYRKYGRFFGVYDGRMPGLTVADPDLLRQLTVKDFWTYPKQRSFPYAKSEAKVYWDGMFPLLEIEKWKTLRNALSPLFTTGKLKQMVPLMNECCKPLYKVLTKFSDEQTPFNAKIITSRLSMDVIASCAFGTETDSLLNPDQELLEIVHELFSPKNLKLRGFLHFIMPWLMPHVPYTWFGAPDPILYLSKLVKQVLERKKSEGKRRKDMLETLMEIKLSPADLAYNKDHLSAQTNAEAKALSEESIISQSILFLSAGHDSTAVTLSFVIYCLAMNPEEQMKVADEVDRALKKHKDIMCYEALSEMPYLDMFINEVMRLYPTANRSERECVVDGALFNGVKLMKGMVIGIPIHCIHHDPEYYPDPEKFDPERFLPENKAKRDPLTYIPFGNGPRNCIGMRFALLEVKLMTAFIVKHFRINKCPQTEVPLNIEFGIFPLSQPKSVTITVTKRD